MPTVRTARVTSGFTTSNQTLRAILTAAATLAAQSRHYEDVLLENLGDVPLYITIVDDATQVPTNADRKTLGVGQQIVFEELDTEYVFIATTDAGATNVLELFGKPVFRPS